MVRVINLLLTLLRGAGLHCERSFPASRLPRLKTPLTCVSVSDFVRVPAAVDSFVGTDASGRAQVNSAPCGVFMGEMDAITSSGTSTVRISPASGGSTVPAVMTISLTGACHFSASASSLGLSHRATPC